MNTDNKMGGLIALGGNLENPGEAKASDFPAVGPSGAEGMSGGAGKLVTQIQNQDGGFTVSTSKTRSTAIKCDWSVDFESGQTIPNAAESY